MKFSLEQRREKVSGALRAKHSGGVDGPYVYVEATFLDSVIYCINGRDPKGEKRYSASYMIAENGEVTLGDPVEVTVVVTYSPVGESEGYLLTPARTAESEQDGSRWSVVIIEEGLSKNRNRYRRQVLEASADKYEGARVYWDHAPGVRSARDLAGFITGVSGVLIEARGGKFALTGTLNVTDPKLKTGLLEAHRLGKADLYGLSHDAAARTQITQEAAGAVRDVLEIQQVLSVDVVSRPAAGGRVVRLAAGDGGADTVTQEQEIQMFEKLLAKLKALGVQVKEGITEDEALALLDSVKEVAPAPKANDAPAPKAESLTEEDRALLRESMIDRAFVGVTLPDQVATLVRKQLALRPTLTLAEANATVKEHVEAYAAASDKAAGSGHGRTVEVTKDEADKQIKALDGFFQQKDIDGQPRFVSFQEAYIAITGDKNLTGRLSEAHGLARFARVKEALQTSSWAEILGDSVTRSMLADYRTASIYDDWRKIVSDITAPRDFRTNRRLRLAGYGDLSTVGEGVTYPTLTSPGDEEATYAVSKKGGIETITMEMIANDDVGAIRRIPRNLSLAAKRTLYKAVFNLLRDNGSVYDSVALAHTNHSNTSTTALSHSEIVTARQKMAEMTAFGNSDDVLNLTPKILIVPAELEELGWRLTSIPMAAESSKAATEPSYSRSRVGLDTLIVAPYWTDANNWWLVANPMEIPTIEVGFYQGRQEPELFVADQPSVGSMFTADKIDYKIRFIFGVAVLDYRGFYGGIVA